VILSVIFSFSPVCNPYSLGKRGALRAHALWVVLDASHPFITSSLASSQPAHTTQL
jgi:hypothetical protein